MPSPIGHALSGLAIRQGRPGIFFSTPWLEAIFFLFLANFPDLDFLPGILTGHPNIYHHGIFHSLGAAVAVAAAGGGFFFLLKRRFWAATAMIFFTFALHLVLDFFGKDFAAPFGMPVFWPFSYRYYLADKPFLLNIERSVNSTDFFPSLFNAHNLKAVLIEITVLGSLPVLAVIVRRWLKKSRPR